MSEVRNSLRRLNACLEHDLSLNVKFEPLVNTKRISEKLEREIMARDVSQPEPVTIKHIINKIRQGILLTRQECRNLPFVMADIGCDIPVFAKCMKNINISDERTLKRFILVYFMYFSHVDEIKKKAFQAIIIKGVSASEYTPRSEFMSKMRYFSKLLFVDTCIQNLSRMIDKWGLNKGMEKLCLPEQIKYSDLMNETVIEYFSEVKFLISNKMLRLQEVIAHKGKYSSVFPKIAGGLILSIAESNNNEAAQYKKICIEALYEELGDPRFGSRTVRWNAVSEKARKIFLSWLAERDLQRFIDTIRMTAVDSMWRYREKFWKMYLPYISNTWVFFGREAMYYVGQSNDDKMAYGRLGSDCELKHSVLAFQIGKYVFVEWSHNGMLRVWEADYAPEVFGVRSLNKRDITSRIPIAEWRHAGKETGNWQNKVRAWIAMNCGIRV